MKITEMIEMKTTMSISRCYIMSPMTHRHVEIVMDVKSDRSSIYDMERSCCLDKQDHLQTRQFQAMERVYRLEGSC